MFYCREPSTVVHATSAGSELLPTQAPPPALDFANAVQGNGFYSDEVADWLREDLLGKSETSDLPPSRKRRRTLAPTSPTAHGSESILFDRTTPPGGSSSHNQQAAVVPAIVSSPISVARSLRQRRISGPLIQVPVAPLSTREPAAIVPPTVTLNHGGNHVNSTTAPLSESIHRRHRRPTRAAESIRHSGATILPTSSGQQNHHRNHQITSSQPSHSNNRNNNPGEAFFFAPSSVAAAASNLYSDALGFPLVSGACPYAHAAAAAAAYTYAPLPAHHPSVGAPLPTRGVWSQGASSTSTPSSFPLGLSPWSFVSGPHHTVPGTSSFLSSHHQHQPTAVPFPACSQLPQAAHHQLPVPHNCMLSSLGLNYPACPRNPSTTSSSSTVNERTAASTRPFSMAPVDHSNRNLSSSRRTDYTTSLRHRQQQQTTAVASQQQHNSQQSINNSSSSHHSFLHPHHHHHHPSAQASPWHPRDHHHHQHLHQTPPSGAGNSGNQQQATAPQAASRLSSNVSSTLAAAQTAAALHFAQTPDVSILLQFLTMIQQPRDQLFLSQAGSNLAANAAAVAASAGLLIGANSSGGVSLGNLVGGSSPASHHHSQQQAQQHTGATPLQPHHLAAAGTNMETLFHLAAQLENRRRGLSKEELDALPTWRFKQRGDLKGEKECQQQTKCMVCLEEFELKQTVRVLACRHEYHSKCVDRWLKNNRTCPMCRADAHDGTHQEEYF